MEFSALNWPITAHTHSEIIKRQIGIEKVNSKTLLTTDWLAKGMNCFFDPTFCYYQVNAIDFNFQTGRKNISMGIKTNLSTELSTEEADNLGSRVLTTWCVVFSVEAALIISGNLYALAIIITGYFDLVRHFTVSLAFTEITRGLTALNLWSHLACDIQMNLDSVWTIVNCSKHYRLSAMYYHYAFWLQSL